MTWEALPFGGRDTFICISFASNLSLKGSRILEFHFLAEQAEVTKCVGEPDTVTLLVNGETSFSQVM